MNDIEINQVLDLARKLETVHQDKTVCCASMVRQIMQDRWDESRAVFESAVRVSGRIYNLIPNAGDARFSMYDYADSIVNAMKTVDLDKLLALDDQDFVAAMTWLAVDKRETYEDRGHAQEPLEIDIYEESKA